MLLKSATSALTCIAPSNAGFYVHTGDIFHCHTTCTIACMLPSYIRSCPFIQQGAPCMCAQVVNCCEPVLIVQCRGDTMPLSCVLWAAILRLLSTLPPRWGATSLTLMTMATQPCTGQPERVSCPWWSTL